MKLKIFAAAAVLVLAAYVVVSGGRVQAAQAEFDGLDEAEMEEVWDFVVGNALFVLMHEAGHMLISEFELPVLGREEDAVDALSTLIMLEAEDDDFDNALIDASDGWFLWAAAAEKAGEELVFWDEHSIEEQRAYAIACMMVGQDAVQFGKMAAVKDMSGERRESCAIEYQQTASSWYKVLAPHIRDDENETPVETVYGDATEPDLAPYAEMFREIDILGLAKALVADEFMLDEGIVFQATSCGMPNAFWDPEERRLTFCYELSRFHAGLIADYLREQR